MAKSPSPISSGAGWILGNGSSNGEAFLNFSFSSPFRRIRLVRRRPFPSQRLHLVVRTVSAGRLCLRALEETHRADREKAKPYNQSFKIIAI